jgi:hypothetical protein
MAVISDQDRTAFQNLCKGNHDFNDEESALLHEMAGKVRSMVEASNDREQKRINTRNQFKQMGSRS